MLVGSGELLAAVGNDQQFVTDEQLGFALRHEVIAVAAHEHDQRILGQRDLAERLSAAEHAFVDLYLREDRLDLLLHVDAESRPALLVGKSQQIGHAADGGALHQERNDGGEEHDVEKQVGMSDPGHHGIERKENGHGAAQPHPRNIKPRLEREAAERSQACEDRNGPRDQNHESPDQQTEDQHFGLQELVAVDEKAQREEHHDLHKPCETVEKDGHGLFLRQAVVADNESSEVDGEITVAADQIGESECKEDESQQQHRIERLVGQVDSVDGEDGEPADKIAGQGADDHLHDEENDTHAHSRVARRTRQHADKQDGEHVGHGVVRTALELEQRPQVLAQAPLLASQDGEDRRGVGGRHGGGQQKRGDERDFNPDERSDQPHEGTEDQGRDNHARGGEHDAGADDGADLRELGVHTARKEDDAQRRHAQEPGHVDRPERNEIQSEKHADSEEQQQGRRSEPIGGLAGDHGHEEQQRSDQHDMFTCKVDHLHPITIKKSKFT